MRTQKIFDTVLYVFQKVPSLWPYVWFYYKKNKWQNILILTKGQMSSDLFIYFSKKWFYLSLVCI